MAREREKRPFAMVVEIRLYCGVRSDDFESSDRSTEELRVASEVNHNLSKLDPYLFTVLLMIGYYIFLRLPPQFQQFEFSSPEHFKIACFNPTSPIILCRSQ